ncbi:MAG: hypothetical protein ABIH23_29075 [bacterium]
MFLFAIPVESAELLYAYLCVEEDVTSDGKDCVEGKELCGPGIVLDHKEVNAVYLITAFKASGDERILHLWFFNETRMPQEKPTVYRQGREGFVEDAKSCLSWLKNTKDVKWWQSLAAAVELVISNSERYRTRSLKKLGPEWVEKWSVIIYQVKSRKELDRIDCEVK